MNYGAAVNRLKRGLILLRVGRNFTSSFCSSSSSLSEHECFIKEIAKAQPPTHLTQLLNIFTARGKSIVSPGAKQGLLPLTIPLVRVSPGSSIALLRWPTAPPSMEMPVVEVQKHGVWFLANNVDQFIHRILVEEDVSKPEESSQEIFDAAGEVGKKLYRKGNFALSTMSRHMDLDAYLLRMVGLFPDSLERKVIRHIENGDHVSAFVAADFYTKRGNFPGFARPFAFNAKVLLKLERSLEAKDAARGALKSSWWTLGCRYEEIARIAEWGEEQIVKYKERVTGEGRQRDIARGKPMAQASLDEAALLLNLASLEGKWDDSLERLAQCYKEAGLEDIAKFVLYRD
ncbi:Protein IN CHLOROPLAST ATPASE BIOGENESIS [Cardamine amara subsp. amara]|uniref:Protein IN CHLOROPLAST ATPASE BIOGENESIS n=1 Tax=Cardamine amara subsp. amara TaxID=228776 RepID=A0ABD1BDJ5_CARAN